MFTFIFFLSIHPAFSTKDLISGWLQGYYNYTEITEYFTEIVSTYPSIAEQGSIGTSFLGNEIPYLKLTQTGIPEAEKPVAVFSASLYSGHPIGSQSVISAIDFILNSQENLQSSITYFIPIINIDAWHEMETLFNTHGALSTRYKNLNTEACNLTDEAGVNLNRNFEYNWGIDDTGSSPNGCSVFYRGKEAGSELETSILQDFIDLLQPGLWLHFELYGEYALVALTSEQYKYKEAMEVLGYEYDTFYDKVEDELEFDLETAYEVNEEQENGTLIDYVYSKGFFPVQVALGENENEQDELAEIVEEVEDLIELMYDSASFEVELKDTDVDEEECGDDYTCTEGAFSYLLFEYELENCSPLRSENMTLNFDFGLPENSTEYGFELGAVYLDTYPEKEKKSEESEAFIEENLIQTTSLTESNTLSMSGEFYLDPYTDGYIYIIIERTKIEGASSEYELSYTFETYPTSVASDPSYMLLQDTDIVEVSEEVSEEDDSDGGGRRRGALIAAVVIFIIVLLIIIGVVIFCVWRRNKKRKEQRQAEMVNIPPQIPDEKIRHMEEVGPRI